MLPTNNAQDNKKKTECLRFVLHEKQAKSQKYVLRLEKDGILTCWILPKGLPKNPKDKGIAVTTDDCKTDMLYFRGMEAGIHKSQAELNIEDSGNYEILLWSDLKIEFNLNGKENSGRYILVKFEKAGPGTWILMKAE